MILIHKKDDIFIHGSINNIEELSSELIRIREVYGGVDNDYSILETDLNCFHLENINGSIIVVDGLYTINEKKSLLRKTRDTLLDEADIKYCNADKWEVMTSEKKQEWRAWKQNMRDWIGVDLDNGTFPIIPEL